MSGRFVKVVIVGPAGVGKTSLRHQYTSGRFATGYRATIGTDFITKTLPHYSQAQPETTTPSDPSSSSSAAAPPTPPVELVTLQIWDTAGQERFSSLSTAFFRGADAVILVFDVNKSETLTDLERWWHEFRIKVPIQEGEEFKYCVVVVGNKTDLVPMTTKAGKNVVGRSTAESFLAKMIPVPDIGEGARGPSPDETPPASLNLRSEPPSPVDPRPPFSSLSTARPSPHPLSAPSHDPEPPASITPRQEHLDPFPKSPSKFGTMNSTRTGLSVYHTPSSSLFHSPIKPFLSQELDSGTTTTRPKSAGSRFHHPPSHDGDDFDMSMDLEYDYDHEVNASSSSMSGYATAKSTPSQSPSSTGSSPHIGGPSQRRYTINSVASGSSLSTVKPNAIPFRTQGFDHPPAADYSPALSPTRSRASTLSSTSSSSATPKHNVAITDLPTPSASPPSPPTLTASLMATLHQQQFPTNAPSPIQKELDLGPKLFFTSAKTLAIRPHEMQVTPVAEIFSYVAERVVRRWEWEESVVELHDIEHETEMRTSVKVKGGGFAFKLSEKWKELVDSRSLSRTCCAT